MAFLSGAAPKPKTGSQTKTKDVVIEVYDDAAFDLAQVSFKKATLGLFMTRQAAELDRLNANIDASLKFLGGLVANNPEHKAKWQLMRFFMHTEKSKEKI